jgi:hypothetical protein
MHTVGFLPDDNTQGPSFEFLDHNAVICMVHLISVYDMGCTRNLLQMCYSLGLLAAFTRKPCLMWQDCDGWDP